MVGDEPVDLLRHLPVEAAEAGFDVREGDVELRRRQRGGEGGVRVAVRHDDIGAAAREDLFEAGQHLAGLAPVAPWPHAEIERGGGNRELVEEDVGHVSVVVLAGVDDDVLDGPPAALRRMRKRAQQGQPPVPRWSRGSTLGVQARLLDE